MLGSGMAVWFAVEGSVQENPEAKDATKVAMTYPAPSGYDIPPSATVCSTTSVNDLKRNSFSLRHLS